MDGIQQLLRLGPFKSLNTRTADVYNDPGNAVAVGNADTHRLGGALASFLGREQYVELTSLDGDAVALARYDVGPTRPFFVAQDASGNSAIYDASNNLVSSISGLSPFTQAVQVNGLLMLNNGQKLFIGPDATYPGTPKERLFVAQWVYQAADQSLYGVSSIVQTSVLAAGTYNYAFVRVVTIPAVNPFAQSSAPIGDDLPYPYTLVADGMTMAAQLVGPFSGTTPDGYAFTTTIYRQSSNQPVWFQLVAGVTGSEYIDSATDASLTGNPQIEDVNDTPPIGLWPIQEYQDRLWTLARVQDPATNNVPQTQLWYSFQGAPWSFDAVNQVLLLGDEFTLPEGSGQVALPSYGDNPVAMARVGSLLVLFKQQSTWAMTGSDQTSYLPVLLFSDVGCLAPQSVVNGNGVVFWLSPQGVYAYDGSSLTYLSDAIYNVLGGILPDALAGAVGAYADLTYFLSIPLAGVTLAMYLPDRSWTQLPYATTAAVSSTSVASQAPNGGDKMNQIVAARQGYAVLDTWLASETDLGNAPTLSWNGPISDSQAPFVQKDYQAIALSAPVQDATVIVTFTIDPGAQTSTALSATFDLSEQGTQVWRIPQGSRGYTCQVSLQATGSAIDDVPIVLWSVTVGGAMARQWTLPN